MSSGVVSPGQTSRAGGDNKSTVKRAKSENNKENIGVRETKASREQELQLAEDELSKK